MFRAVNEWSTVELLGPLNAVEHKFAPSSLWTQGDVGLLQHHPRVAVVGTRSPSPGGQRRTVKLVQGLVEADAVVVSGLALGIIVEAGATSGTQSQGWEALRLGRPLFLLRSLVDSGLAWPREMLDHGAFVLNDMADLLSVLTVGDLREAVAF